MTPPARRWQVAPRTAYTVMLLGALIAVVGVAVVVVAFFRTAYESPALSIPGATHLHLSSGEYVLYERTGSQRSIGITITENRSPSIRPRDVTVAAPDRGVIIVRARGDMTERIFRGSKIYTGVVRFDVPESADYDVRVDAATTGEVLIARSLSGVFVARAPWIVVALVGGVALFVGLLLRLNGPVRRSAPATTLPPPGWYGDTERPGRDRYWDGARWTDEFVTRDPSP